jgi:hypothetical protein
MAPPSPLRAFRDSQRPALVALARGMFGPKRLQDGREERLVAEVDAHVAAASPVLRIALVLLFDVLRVLPVIVRRSFQMLDSLGPEDCSEVLASIDRSPRLGMPLVAYKTLFTIAFYELPGELESVGYRAERRRYLLAPRATEGQ